MKKAIMVFVGLALIIASFIVIDGGEAGAWHGALTIDVECVNDQSVATATLEEPGESWNSSHSDMVVLAQTGGVFEVGKHVPFGGSYSPNSFVITDAKTVTLELGWVGSTETSSVTATGYPVKDCHVVETTTTTVEQETTTTTEPVDSTTTTEEEHETTTTTAVEEPTTTVGEDTTTTAGEETTTAPPAVVAPPVVVTQEPVFTG